MKLLQKEFRLCMHPTALLMPLLGGLVLVPGYPYGVCFFYMTLAIYFVCLTGRENHDAAFTLSLPVSRREMARARILFACCLEGFQLAAVALFLLVKRLIGGGPNPAGLDGNVALLGQGLIVFALFNVIFFPGWYKNIQKLGGAFLLASAAVFVYITLGVVATYALPFVRDCLDTPDPAFLTEKLLYLLCAAALFPAAAWLAIRLSVKRLENQDLTL